jgi:hypothetical protein
MHPKSSALQESDIDATILEETCSTTISSVTPDLDEAAARLSTKDVSATYEDGFSSRGHTLIIFDYDDTILPTSFLSKHGFKLDSPAPTGDLKRALSDYSRHVNRTLKEAKKRGHVIIVTNAEAGWIQLTVEKYMPLSAAMIHEFQHISARSIFEPAGLVTPIQWKESAFRLVVEEYLGAMGAVPSTKPKRKSLKNGYQVISLGDSAHEREAVLKVCGEFRIISKSLKFMERPDLDALVKQHLLIHECLHEIVRSQDNLDLCIQTSPVKSTE